MPIDINSWKDFEEVLDGSDLASTPYTSYLFRGQNQAWDVEPSLARRLHTSTEQIAVNIESNTHHFFMANAHDYLPDNQYQYLRIGNHPVLWWTVMQHQGCPTRLIDWTQSAYTALYFACNGSPSEDGAVYIFDSMRLSDELKSIHRRDPSTYSVGGQDYFEAFFEGLRTQVPPAPSLSPQGEEGLVDPPGSVPDIVSTVFPRFSDTRITSQQGAFTLGNRVLGNHWTSISSVLSAGGALELRIDKDMKPRFMARLRTMNIQGLSLFPGIHGLCRYALEKAEFSNLARSQTL